jgi:hypothetical protein
VAASASLPLPARSKRTAEPSAERSERAAGPPPDLAPDLFFVDSEGAWAETPLTSEPPLADAEPLTSEPPLADTAPLTSESATTGGPLTSESATLIDPLTGESIAFDDPPTGEFPVFASPDSTRS